jgi:catechol 2,3-dioxygenase-like lactoylglutathione lyase family enzyme
VTPKLDFFGIVVSDMARSVAFYRRLGLEFPAGAENEQHVEAALPGGMRYALDTEEFIHAFDPEWERPSGGHAGGGAFRCESSEEVDRVYRELLDAVPRPTRNRGTRSGASATRSSRTRMER